ncbi:MAG TPA: hypothetical protein DCQ43_04035 [Treponema sp.]|nr:hypothetical protein [Treponema sp.]
MQMQKRFKKFFCLVFVLCGLSALSAQNVLSSIHHQKEASEIPWFEFEKSQSVWGGLALNSHTSYEPYILSFQGLYHLEMQHLALTAGLQFAKECVQLSSEVVWYPVQFEKMRAGLGTSVNFFFDSVYAFELNLLPGAYMEWRPCSWFLFTMHVNYLFKTRAIYAVAGDIGMLNNHSAAIGFRCSFYVPGGFTFYLAGDADELFRYMILGIPTFTAGAAYNVDRLTFALELNVRFIDFFTLSATCEGMETRLLVGYRL